MSNTKNNDNGVFVLDKKKQKMLYAKKYDLDNIDND